MKNKIFLWLVILLVIITGWLLIPAFFWRYFFFLRIPLLMGLLLLGLPAIAKFILPAMLKNLFVLRGAGQMAFTILGATVAGMAVVFVAAIIIDNAPARFGVPHLPTIPRAWYYVSAIALTLPTTLAVTDLSGEEINNSKRLQGLALGSVLGGSFLFLFYITRNFLAIDNTSNPWVAKLVTGLNHFLVQIISWLAKQSTAGYINPKTGNLTAANFDAFVFFIVLLVVYLGIFIIYRPRLIPYEQRKEAPALLYVMLLIAIATLFLGNFTFYFDYSRVSVLFFWLVVAGLMYGLLRVDHFFVIKPDPQQPQQTTDFNTVISKRLHNQTLVIVCASGGGIQAAGWTAQVLTGLQADDLLGKSFPKAINLISAVSGGSVGAMYYLDRFISEGFPPDTELDNIFNSATEDSLDAVGWGLAYPDLWRMISLPILAPQLLDRGTALETDWQSHMQKPREDKTLATWRQEIMQGNLPIPVFNTTLVEDGFRLLISPMNFGKSSTKKFFDFHSLYPDCDLNVVTAARLSATFPYVSPICRDNLQIQKNYHIADGGYFDNSGFVTAVEWLMELLKTNNSQEHKLKNILILQINPFPKSSLEPQGKKNPGLSMAILGPLLTIFKVRDPISQARNCAEVELLQQKWQLINQTCQEQTVNIQYFPIFFPSKEQAPVFYNQQGEYRPPLSWKLTQKEKDALKHGWEAIKNSKQITQLKELWRDKWKMSNE